MTEDKREALAAKGFTDFLFPLDTSTLKSWFLLDDEQGRIYRSGANYKHFLQEM